MVVVCDTSPINYLILIGHVDVLPRVLGEIVVPTAVLAELRDSGAAAQVREWAGGPPNWVRVADPGVLDVSLALGPGERSALSLALEMRTQGRDVRVLIDERDGRAAARARGLPVLGTLAVLIEAAAAGMIDMSAAIAGLRATSFHASPQLYEEALRLRWEREERG